mmetsp:Transcript_26740/g.61695  ORF Transcript_26740/g.61695 Transcript_26740/m.61695 type:complete len:222 (-) Transcript_26740:132-797(-)
MSASAKATTASAPTPPSKRSHPPTATTPHSCVGQSAASRAVRSRTANVCAPTSSTARSRSSTVTATGSPPARCSARLVAARATPARSAPVNSAARPTSTRSASSETAAGERAPAATSVARWICRISSRPRASGGRICTCTSKRPGRSSAGSIRSMRFVVPITSRLGSALTPSSFASSVFTTESLMPGSPTRVPLSRANESSSSSTSTCRRVPPLAASVSAS